MATRKKALISNDNINSYGFRILTSGIDIEQYKRNPILLFMHRRPGGKEDALPLGVVEDLEIVDNALYGVPVIQPVDDFSRNIATQWDNGTLKMVSGNFNVIEWSEDMSVLKEGQTRPTLIKCKLTEVSIVDIGGNDDALALSYEGKNVHLGWGTNDCDIPFIKLNSEAKMNELQQVALALGLKADAKIAEILKAITAAQSSKVELSAATKELESIRLDIITGMVDDAIKEKRIKSDQKDHFVNLGKATGAESLKITLAAITAVREVRPTDVIGTGVQLGQSDYKKLSDVPSEEMSELKEKDPATYRKLYKAEYGFDCQI